jgi:hypothetical protein
MIKTEEAQAWIKSIKYKPKWNIYINENKGGPTLAMAVWVPDVRTPGKETMLVHQVKIPMTLCGKLQFINWVFRKVQQMELHEAMEWFTVEGRRIFDPHEHEKAVKAAKTGIIED